MRICLAVLVLALGCATGAASESEDDTLPYEPFNGGVRTEEAGAEDPAEREADPADSACAANAAPERLACHFAERASRAMPDAELSIVSVDLVTLDGQEVALDALRAVCDREPERCVERMDEWITSMAQAREAANAPATPERLRPVLKHRDFVASLRARVPAVADMTRPFVGDVYVVLVVDLPEATRGLDPDDLETLGMTIDQAHARALRNLRAHHADLPVEPMPNGLRAMGPTDGYAAARLLLHDLWAPVAGEVEGDLIVAPCNRDLVILSGDSAEAVEALKEASIRAYRYVDHPITDALWRWTPEGWVTVGEASARPRAGSRQST